MIAKGFKQPGNKLSFTIFDNNPKFYKVKI